MTESYDLENFNNQLEAIKVKRHTTYKRLAVFFGVSTRQLYNIRKGKSRNKEVVRLAENTYDDIFEKWYVAVLVHVDDYYYIYHSTKASREGAVLKLRDYNLENARVSDEILTPDWSDFTSKMKGWLWENNVKNGQAISAMIGFDLRGEIER